MYLTAWFCISCKNELTDDQVHYRDGRCIHCGYKGPDAGTIVDTFEKPYKIVKVKSGKWYWPLKKEIRVFDT